MSLFKKYAEDLEDMYESDEYVDASADDAGDVADEVAEEVEEKLEKEVEAMVNFLTKKRASASLVQYIIRQANVNGVLLSPVGMYAKRSASSNKLSVKERQFADKVVDAFVKATERILASAAVSLRTKRASKLDARKLDKKLLADGYVRSSIANPIPDAGQKRVAARSARSMSLGRRK